MRDTPINLRPRQARAATDGRLSALVVPIKPQPSAYKGAAAPPPSLSERKHAAPYFDAYCGGPFGCWWDEYDRQGPDWIRLPLVVGRRYWARETWCCNGWATDVATIFYRASEGRGYTAMCEQFPVADHRPLPATGTWRPSTQMPAGRRASRLSRHRSASAACMT